MSDQESFVTVIILAHGEDLESDKATPEQFRTLRKFTVAGKCGHLNHFVKGLNDTVFDISHQLAQLPHMPFTEKLKTLKIELDKRPELRRKLQEMYESEPAKEKAKYASCPRASDWFATSQVSYNHKYLFRDDPADPWERKEFGIWLVDGGPHILKGEMRTLKNNIMPRIGFPPGAWDFDITLFELADRLKQLFRVKYVNFIDLSCRFRVVDRSLKSRLSSLFWSSDDVPSAELREITPRAGERRIHDFNGMKIEIMDAQPPGLPAGWLYVRNLSDGTYVYVNYATREISVDFPELPHAPRPNIFVGGLELEIVDLPKITGIPRQLPPGWEYARILRTREEGGGSVYVNTNTGEITPDFPGEIRRRGGSKKSSKKNKKKTKRRKNK